MAEPLIRIKGLDEAIKKLESTDPKKQLKNYRAAARSAMLPLRNAVRKSAQQIDDPSTSRSIAKNVAIRSVNKRKLKQAGGDVGASVGIAGGARQYADSKENRRKGRAGQTYETGGSKTNPGGDTWYWRLIEFGRSAFTTGKSSITGKRVNLFNPVTGKNYGYKVKGVTARSFMRPALPQNINQVMDRFAKRIKQIIDKSA
ncbi:HK97-gp10 family putative phage morphogenesis protein [Alishewanella sp. d11]|uniref:HK97-gp10 family putative phage morphogenesis protein n=1 Tax=Alishewanella sp. d11 TaxID=3414030 RepID=UPI003BF8AFC1